MLQFLRFFKTSLRHFDQVDLYVPFLAALSSSRSLVVRWSVGRSVGRLVRHVCEKARIRETKHLSTDADSSTDAIGGWTKNTPKPASYQYNRLISQYNRLMSLYNRLTETGPQNQQKKNFFLRGGFRPLPNKNVQI